MSEWIPVSERLPDLNGRYLVTLEFTDRRIVQIVRFAKDMKKVDRYYKTGSGWHKYVSAYGEIRINNVIAWMPLPQPYKAESEKDVCKDCYYNDGEVHAECVMCDKAESEE